MAESNAVGWFEIPVLDMAWFPWVEGGTGAAGSLVYHEEMYKPSMDGVLIYFTSRTGDIAGELARVEDAGGKVLAPKTLITEDIGYLAVCMDTEGNKIALHSMK